MDSFADLPPFDRWSGRNHAFGPISAQFAGRVLDGLTTAIDEHITDHPRDAAVLGCIPWLTDFATVRHLQRLQCCLVINKKNNEWPSRAATHLQNKGLPFPLIAIPGLEEMAPIEGIIGSQWPPGQDVDLGPVRTFGHRPGAAKLPILHTKILVLGTVWWREPDSDYGLGLRAGFEPVSVWMGSANFTELSRVHLEVGLHIRDVDLTRTAAAFVGDVISASEPFGSTTEHPTPELRTVLPEDTFDVEAHIEWMHEMEALGEEPDDEDRSP